MRAPCSPPMFVRCTSSRDPAARPALVAAHLPAKEVRIPERVDAHQQVDDGLVVGRELPLLVETRQDHVARDAAKRRPHPRVDLRAVVLVRRTRELTLSLEHLQGAAPTGQVCAASARACRGRARRLRAPRASHLRPSSPCCPPRSPRPAGQLLPLATRSLRTSTRWLPVGRPPRPRGHPPARSSRCRRGCRRG